jgi:hypothetical protein
MSAPASPIPLPNFVSNGLLPRYPPPPRHLAGCAGLILIDPPPVTHFLTTRALSPRSSPTPDDPAEIVLPLTLALPVNCTVRLLKKV